VSSSKDYWVYDGFLLGLAHDIGTRLLPAFNTRTGIPYGTVNLLYGVPRGETSIASLAGGGTLTLEMELLSRLTKDEKFGKLARLSARALFSRRSGFDLLGKHININDGKWTETVSGVGSNSDSFYEYLLKDHILFHQDEDFFTMFNVTYSGIYLNARIGDWYPDVIMNDGLANPQAVFESLAAFYPGMQVLLGEINPAARSANAFTLIREFTHFLPERFNFARFEGFTNHRTYPLRPELYESNYFLHLATRNLGLTPGSSWKWNADFFLNELDESAKTGCGYAAIRGISSTPDIATLSIFDEMPSFFLSETLKYLYMTFNDNNIIDGDKERAWVFTTEAHPFYSASSVNISDHWLEKARSELLETLEVMISLNMPQNHTTPSIASNGQSMSYFHSEVWSLNTGKFPHIKDLLYVNSKKKLFNYRSNQDLGRLVDLPQNRMEVDSYSSHILNFAFLSHSNLGRGSRLSKSCPNYHQSNSLWAHALVGEEIDYTYFFETTLSNDENVHSIKPKVPSSLTASTLLGTSYMPYSSTKCRNISRHQGIKKQEADVSRIGSKIVDVPHLGSFEIAVSSTGLGYFVKHLTSGESLEVTIVHLANASSGDDQVSIAVDSYILADAELKGKSSLMNQFKAFLKIKPPRTRLKTRHVVIADMHGNAFECKVELKRSYSKMAANDTIHFFPCLPASYGPSSMNALRSGLTSGTEFEAKLYEPHSTDSYGCHEDRNDELGDDSNLDETSSNVRLRNDSASSRDQSNYSPDDLFNVDRRLHAFADVCPVANTPRVQMVKRGKCNFRSKGINLKKRFNAEAVIVVNSDEQNLFLMSGTLPTDQQRINQDDPMTVLVSQEDGKQMIEDIERHRADGVEVNAAIRIIPRTRNSLENSHVKDSESNHGKNKIDWPLVVTKPRNFQVYASQGWGVGAVQEEKNDQWQIILLQHNHGL
jgi:mannosidase alpha-like ER degradation enhancer 2